MASPGWRTTRIVHGYRRNGRTEPVSVGLIEGNDGRLHIAERVGEDGELVVLRIQDAEQHAANILETVAELVRLGGERLGGDEP